MEILSEHTCQGWLEGYLLTGRHGIFNTYEAFVHIVDSMFNQHAKWLEVSRSIAWRQPIASLNYIITSHVWRQDNNGFTHQDPGFLDVVMNKTPDVVRVYLPPDANTMLSVLDHCLRTKDYINVIVAGKHPEAQWLDVDAAVAHCTEGLGIWPWASTDAGIEPDVVMACAGDVPTLETLAAVDFLRTHVPEMRVRVVNVVDLMTLLPDIVHPHGLSDLEFDSIFTADKPIVFAFHGYPWLIHRLTYRRNGHARSSRTRLPRTRHNDHAVRHDGAEPARSLPSGGRCDRPRTPLVRSIRAREANSARQARRTSSLHREARSRHAGDFGLALGIAGVNVLTFNAGSSSLKCALHDATGADVAPLYAVSIELKRSTDTPASAAGAIAREVRSRGYAVDAVAHRFVFGGEMDAPTEVTGAVRRRLDELASLDPLHAPQALAVLDVAAAAFPGVTQIACFDTAFFKDLPPIARVLPVPTNDPLLRRYGFHGLSYEYAVAALGDALAGRAIVAHLGSGSSLAAALRRQADRNDDGIQSARRRVDEHASRRLDPGVFLYLSERASVDRRQLRSMLERDSGLRAIAGGEGDVRTLSDRANAGDPRAAFAVECYVRSIVKAAGALAAVLGGLDALAFTGGIGEHLSSVRAAIAGSLGHLGVVLDDGRNAVSASLISASHSRVTVHVVAADENLMMARHAYRHVATDDLQS